MEYEKKYDANIYPVLPGSAPPEENTSGPSEGAIGHNYRIRKISEVQRSLEEERVKRYNLSKKYYRGVKVINNVDAVLTTTSMGLGVAGVGLLSTVVLTPVVLAMEGVAIGAGLLSVIGKYATKKMSIKAKKHERIQILAEAKLNSINDQISKALNDGNISEEEFSLIISELTKFQAVKQNIKTTSREVLDDETRTSLIEQGRREARENFSNYLKKK